MNMQNYKYDKVTDIFEGKADPKRKKVIKENSDKFDKLTRRKK